jgi:UDP-N-acetylglucosamine:LPS N-acetylglucosamine transferase
MGLIGEELAQGDIRVMVVDVSVEVTVFARLFGIPVVVMAQPGDRSDRPHRMAYDLAARLLAPWPAFAESRWPRSWQDKTVHVGAFSRFDGRHVVAADPNRRVLAMWGSGGLDVGDEDVRAAALATADWQWDVIGPNISDGSLPNLTWHGWVNDVWPRLSAANVVVTHAGQNALAEVAAARRPAVVVPQDRPHNEQHATAAALRNAGIGVIATTWPRPREWPRLLEQATAESGDAWSQWSPGDGAQRAAAILDALAT